MNTTLQTLIQLQNVDAIIFDVQQKIAAFPEMIKRLDQQLADDESRIALMHSRLEEQEKLRRTKELDIEAREEQIKKYQNQLLQVKTNKEYSALLVEITGLKNKNSLTEDEILELMESLERAKKAISETKQHLEQETIKLNQVKKQKEAEQVELQKLLAAEHEKRSQIVGGIEAKVLQEYSKLLKLRNGMAVTSVKEEGVCDGCHVALTPQMLAEIKMGEYMHRCPVCFRFLYWSANNLSGENVV